MYALYISLVLRIVSIVFEVNTIHIHVGIRPRKSMSAFLTSSLSLVLYTASYKTPVWNNLTVVVNLSTHEDTNMIIFRSMITTRIPVRRYEHLSMQDCDRTTAEFPNTIFPHHQRSRDQLKRLPKVELRGIDAGTCRGDPGSFDVASALALSTNGAYGNVILFFSIC
ncbi:hypothetical protein FF1_012154 [Malus domestica]